MERVEQAIRRLFPFTVPAGRMAHFAGRAAAAVVASRFYAACLAEQMARMCVHCMVPILFVLAPMGAVVAMESLKVFAVFGAQGMTSSLLSVALFREIAPVMVAVMVASQTGAEVAAELGAMRVRQQLDAMEVMAVDPVPALVVPRILAGMLITPVLTLVGSFTGVAGGYLIAVPVMGANGGAFAANLFSWVEMSDVAGGLVKAAVFGLGIMTISCYHGFRARGGASGVGRATNDAVVASVVSVLVLNYFLTTAFFGFDI